MKRNRIPTGQEFKDCMWYKIEKFWQKHAIGIVAILCIVLIILSVTSMTRTSNTTIPIEMTVYSYDKFELFEVMLDIVECESEWDIDAIGMSGEIGLAQFTLETWEWLSEEAEFEGNISNPSDQLRLLLWGLVNGYEDLWTCYNQ